MKKCQWMMLSCRTKIIEPIEFQIINLRIDKIGIIFQIITAKNEWNEALSHCTIERQAKETMAK